LQTRRQFVTSAGSFAAATVFAPQALAQGLTSARRAPLLRGGKFADGLMSGDPTPNGITLWTRVAGIGGSGRVELEVARDKSFRHVVTRKEIGSRGPEGAAMPSVRLLAPRETVVSSLPCGSVLVTAK